MNSKDGSNVPKKGLFETLTDAVTDGLEKAGILEEVDDGLKPDAGGTQVPNVSASGSSAPISVASASANANILDQAGDAGKNYDFFKETFSNALQVSGALYFKVLKRLEDFKNLIADEKTRFPAVLMAAETNKKEVTANIDAILAVLESEKSKAVSSISKKGNEEILKYQNELATLDTKIKEAQNKLMELQKSKETVGATMIVLKQNLDDSLASASKASQDLCQNIVSIKEKINQFCA
jgi:hypothetical protein